MRKLVFTSSAGVVFNGKDIIDVDERMPFPEVHMDAYNQTKAEAEVLVLEANGKGGLLTVALRPAGIFGWGSQNPRQFPYDLPLSNSPGDRQVMAGFYQAYEKGQTNVQVGDNNNLFDWTYVGNVARAHLIAADKLDTPPPALPLSELEKQPTSANEVPPLSDAELKMLNHTVFPIGLTAKTHRIPTCEARPLGPYVTLPPNGEKIAAAFEDPDSPVTPRPVMRTRFDPLSEPSLNRAKVFNPDTNPLQVAGQVFFITNGEPIYFWDMPRMVWNELDKYFPGKRTPKSPFKMSRPLGMVAGWGSEWLNYLRGSDPIFTRFRVTFMTATRWHNIEKARRVLGYEPEVGLEEGVKRMVEVCALISVLCSCDFDFIFFFQSWYAEFSANQKKA